MSVATRTIDAWLATHAAHQPAKVALRCEGQSWTYAALHAWVEQLAAGLFARYGLKGGERVAFLGHNSASEIALFFAAARLGLIVVPLNWRLAPDELVYMTANADVRLFIHGPEFRGVAEEVAGQTGTARLCAETEMPALLSSAEAPRGAALGDPFLIVYTSGTTGRPKGAVMTQEAVLWNALASLHAHDLTSDDHVLNILPLFHVGGINIQTLPTFFVGGTVTLHAAFDPGRVLHSLAEEGVTTTVCVPTVMQALMAHPDWAEARFPRLRLLTTGSTDVPVEILQAVNARGIPMVQVYGATETGPVSTYQRAAEARETIGSIGRPGAHVEVRIVGPDGQDCAEDVPGEIWVRAPNLFSHYWQNAQATEAAFVEGWFRTGDVARRDAAGLLWFVSRLKHVIISGGENIYPAEIERILATLPGLREVAVVGRPHARWGEVPVVVCAADEGGPSAERILAACNDVIAKFKRPRDVVFVDALPRNAMGKVMFDAVRELAQTPAMESAT